MARPCLILTLTALLFLFLIYVRMDISRFRREKSKTFVKDQESKRQAFLNLSLAARNAGSATEQQLHFLTRYERVANEEDKRLQERSMFGRFMDTIAPGVMSRVKESDVLAQMDDELEKEWEARQAKVRQEEAEAMERQRVAANAELEKSTSKGWLSWWR
jgi:hypothetical protein